MGHSWRETQKGRRGNPAAFEEFSSCASVRYVEFLGLLSNAALVLTDSGGIQEETSVLGVPCLTLRSNTERPITCELGTNQVIGTDPKTIADAANKALSQEWNRAAIPLWDGKVAERIAEVLNQDLG